MKVSYITTYNASDIHNWSGTGYYIAKSLENQNADIDFIGNLKTHVPVVLKLKQKFYGAIGKSFDIYREPYIANQLAKQAKSSLNHDTDIVFSPGSVPIALLKTEIPKVFYTDATFAGMIDFYDAFSNFCPETIRHGNYLEQMALESSALAIYSSKWAAQSAIENYKVDPQKIKIVPFGANIDVQRSLEEMKHILSNRSEKECALLFIGVDWRRKGGDLAVKIAEQLNHIGVETELNVVGVKDIPSDNLPDFVVNHGFISKSTPKGREILTALFSRCHFLILPSQADCTPIVIAEANSFGLPCVATNVGGIPTIIKDDINGKTFSLNAEIIEWSDYISSTFVNNKRYRELCISSFNEFQTRLNWNAAGKEVIKLIEEL
jgi:glycosyltransferase involved in cell wall biosynthesis